MYIYMHAQFKNYKLVLMISYGFVLYTNSI